MPAPLPRPAVTLAEAIARAVTLTKSSVFPARTRVVLDSRLAIALPALARAGFPTEPVLDLLRIEPPELAGAATAGLAAAEALRGGQVVLIAADPGPVAVADRFVAALGLTSLESFAVTLPAGPARPVDHRARRREWPAVALESIPRSLIPPWPSEPGIAGLRPACAEERPGGPRSQEPLPASALIDAALAWLAEREPALLLPHRDPAWSALPADPETVFALAQLAGEGRRICWKIPGNAWTTWGPVLTAIGQRGLPLTLILEQESLAAGPRVLGIEDWWVTSPTDSTEASNVLAWALSCDQPVLIELPSIALADLPQPESAFTPGSGRWLRQTGTGKPTVTGSTAAARTALAGTTPVYACTSLLPLPIEAHRLLADGAAAGPELAAWAQPAPG